MNLSKTHYLWFFLIAIGLVRLISLTMYPLMDTTEARYGEIARIMLETGNWITPQIDYGIPFWGKPPLQTWVSALSAAVLGNSEFSLRLPLFLSAVLVLWLVWQLAIQVKLPKTKAIYALAVVATSLGFLISSGIIMTDMLLTLSMTLAMLGFWGGWHGDRGYNALLYIGLGMGMLAKGPVIIVLVVLALLPWLLIHYGWIQMWKQIWLRLNIIPGLSLTLLIAAPWYILAEQATPGFLEYFLVGEHFQRFIDSGWQGDLYGSGHPRNRGTIWLYWFQLTLPWSPVLLWVGISHFFKKKCRITSNRNINIFLLGWMCSPLVLFTLATNILPAYVLPGLPAIGLLLVVNSDIFALKKARLMLLISPLLLIALTGYIQLYAADDKSEKKILSHGLESSHKLYYYQSRPYSAQYYSSGKAVAVQNLPDSGSFYIVIDRSNTPENIEDNCLPKSMNKERILYLCGQQGS